MANELGFTRGYNADSTYSLYHFMQQLNSNNVRTQNLFEMRIWIPSFLNSNNKYPSGGELTRFFNPNFTFYGTGFELPARTLQYQDVGFKGFTVPVPTVLKMTQEHSVTINADINGDMRRAFLAWQALTMNPQIDDEGGYFEGNRQLEHSGKIRIHLLDPTYAHPSDKESIIEQYTLYGVTVQEVGTMTFSNTEAGLATFNVIFKSQYWQYGGTFDRDKDAELKDAKAGELMSTEKIR